MKPFILFVVWALIIDRFKPPLVIAVGVPMLMIAALQTQRHGKSRRRKGKTTTERK
jgi:hypothetical protein